LSAISKGLSTVSGCLNGSDVEIQISSFKFRAVSNFGIQISSFKFRAFSNFEIQISRFKFRAFFRRRRLPFASDLPVFGCAGQNLKKN
jgi:hypothetical protein